MCHFAWFRMKHFQAIDSVYLISFGLCVDSKASSIHMMMWVSPCDVYINSTVYSHSKWINHFNSIVKSYQLSWLQEFLLSCKQEALMYVAWSVKEILAKSMKYAPHPHNIFAYITCHQMDILLFHLCIFFLKCLFLYKQFEHDWYWRQKWLVNS